MKRTHVIASVALLCAAQAFSQNENRLQRDFRVEGESLKKCGSLSNIADCGQTLFTGQPLHIAVGSLAPQNGMAFGLAFVEHFNAPAPNLNSPAWRYNFNLDAQASKNGSWRAGAYVKAYTSNPAPIVATNTVGKARPLYDASILLTGYAETTSLNRVDFYGLGPTSLRANQTTYGFRETIVGANAIIPIGGFVAALHPSIVLELNGRLPQIRPGQESTIRSATAVFTDASAPGLNSQPGFINPSEGVRLTPRPFKDYLRLNYLVQFHQFIAPSNGAYTFRRFNGDFTHTIPIYAFLTKNAATHYNKASATTEHNGPDDCSKNNAGNSCPKVSLAQNLEGSITLRSFLSESFAGSGSRVPFYFMPTLGGSDINGTTSLASYPDYRFRGPDLLLFRATVEHSIGTLPVGAMFSAEAGKIGLRRDDMSLDHFRHSYSAGITLRAGGLPLINLLFSWGGGEGTHTAATISPFLLGGSSKPSLF